LECGFLMCQHKPLLLLKDKQMQQLPSDIIGRLYRTFDSYAIEQTVRSQVERWVRNHAVVFDLPQSS
ncbi:MAG: hypothetical protein ABGY41_03450, partial [Candidatus Poribacteria bacterium]